MECTTCYLNPGTCLGNNGQKICVDCEEREHLDFELELRLRRALEKRPDLATLIAARLEQLDQAWQVQA